MMPTHSSVGWGLKDAFGCAAGAGHPGDHAPINYLKDSIINDKYRENCNLRSTFQLFKSYTN
jgi:hypothetical protein